MSKESEKINISFTWVSMSSNCHPEVAGARI
jgi:hypothetical protein